MAHCCAVMLVTVNIPSNLVAMDMLFFIPNELNKKLPCLNSIVNSTAQIRYGYCKRGSYFLWVSSFSGFFPFEINAISLYIVK